MVTLALGYGYVLFSASTAISNGAELLQVVPWLGDVVGSVLLPILGAVPDGAIILFSGLAGERAAAQEELSIGVGALAGSTVLLLTLPWAATIVGGRVSLGATGRGNYHAPTGWDATSRGPWAKLLPPGSFHLTRTGVNCGPAVAHSGRIMALTALLYLLAQGPAASRNVRAAGRPQSDEEALAMAAFERPFAMAALVACAVCFMAYLIFKAITARQDLLVHASVDSARVDMIRSGRLTLAGALSHLVDRLDQPGAGPDVLAAPLAGSALQADAMAELRRTVRPFFRHYDVDNSGAIDSSELRAIFADMHEGLGQEELDAFVRAGALPEGTGGEGPSGPHVAISFDAFTDLVVTYLRARRAVLRRHASHALGYRRAAGLRADGAGDSAAYHLAEAAAVDEAADGDDDDDDDVPDHLKGLAPEEQHRRVIATALRTMGAATAVVLLFSDPMVSVLSSIARRLGIPAFFVAFIAAPLASNSSEVLSAYAFGRKRTLKATTISFSTLLGAAIMNNTFCLFVFMGLIVARGDLFWEFSSETLAILLVEVCMVFVSQRPVQRLRDAAFVVLLFPGALALVVALEAAGFD